MKDLCIDVALVRALLEEQHPDLAGLPLRQVAAGWDNEIFRLGDDLAIRLPRRHAAVALIGHEQQWLPRLAPRLSLAVPVPVRIGIPSSRFPARWSIVPWLRGASALHAGFDRGADGRALGDFLHRLHAPAPPDAPRNPWRGVPLAERTGWLCEHARAAGDHRVDRRDVMRVWNDALSAAPWSGPPLWIHGDLHPGNLLVREGAISAVIDFGDLTSGDPATDFACVWMLGAPFVVSGLVETARNEWTAADDDLMRRARGWALAIGLAILASPHADAPMQRMAAATVMATLQHEVPR